MDKLSLVLLAALLCSVVKPLSSMKDNRQVLYVIASGPYPDTLEEGGWAGGIPLVAAVRLAFNHINNNSKILPDYRLEALDDDSGCRVPSKALLSLYRSEFYSGKSILGIIGPACSESTLLVAPLLARPEVSIIQIAPSATSPEIQALDQNTTFTMITPLAMVGAFITTVNINNWRQFTIIYDANRLLFRAFNDKVFQTIAENNLDINIIESLIIIDIEGDISFPISELRRSRSRVVLLLMEPASARRFLCVAVNSGLYYPRYQWVVLEKSRGEFEEKLMPFDYRGRTYECSSEMMAKAINGGIISQYELSQDNGTMISPNNITFKEYREGIVKEFQEHFNEPRVQAAVNSTSDTYQFSRLEPKNNWENLYYDAAWALALALDGAARNGVNLSEYKYGQPEITKILIDELFKVEFEGAVGPIKFTSDRTVQSPVIVSQLWEVNGSLSETKVALFRRNKLELKNITFVSISDTFGELQIRIHLSLGIIIILITITLTIVTACLQIAFIKWSKKKSIKATSPEISYLIFSGCYLFATATIVFTIQQTFVFDTPPLRIVYSVMCNAVTWCLLLGFSLIFGTVFVKVWRVFKLFRHFRNERPGLLLSDRALIIAVICLVVVDTVICVVWSSYDPWMLLVSPGEIQDVPGDEPVVVSHLSCVCEFYIYWIVIIAAYKGSIALLLVIFSVLNRKIQRKHFSHTKKVNILVYSLTVLGGIGFPLYFLLANISIYITFLIFSAILLATVLMCCLMLFLPPVWPAFKLHTENSEWITYTERRLDRLNSSTSLRIDSF